ncbi:MAG: hypothetical protein H7Y43_11000 [Akkermansiaceae bacterium]|nr:hypothetical protein [Verrucomicrobiales bacterium]
MPYSHLPAVHMLTCAPRAVLCGETVQRWARTVWPVTPRVHWDTAKEDPLLPWGSSARARRLTDAFAAMLRAALLEPGVKQEWLLFLEDDLDFHPRICALVESWEALRDTNCLLASLFNPSIRADPRFPAPARAFSAKPTSFLGAQALLLRRPAAMRALVEWDGLTGMTSQRLTALCGKSHPIWVHQPSLVQHISKDSSWGARVQVAPDFDPAWNPPPLTRT